MKDQRVVYLRGVLESLLESLDATVRLARWSGTESVPDPLEKSASLLLDRLGTANRLASGRFVGSPVVVSVMTTMSAAIQRLDVAFVQYRRKMEGSQAQKEEAANSLDAEIGAVKQDAHRWA
jgi:hypothetical protein